MDLKYLFLLILYLRKDYRFWKVFSEKDAFQTLEVANVSINQKDLLNLDNTSRVKYIHLLNKDERLSPFS